ncbi:MAG: bifunctional metallophosphatase/5'-nucleotidase [Anaerolineaceae bacterium]
MTENSMSVNFGTLRVIPGQSGLSESSDSKLFLFVGDATSHPIHSIVPDSGVILPGPREKKTGNDFLLTIYHFNDLHGHLVRFIPGGEDAVISRMAWQIHEKRKSVLNDPDKAVMTFSAGDDCIGSVFDELLGSKPSEFETHASYQLYSELGVDAACLGNHDFDLGFPLLIKSIKQNAKFPILVANLSGCDRIKDLVFPAAIKVVKGIRVGLIGLVTQAELKISDSNCSVTDPFFAAKNLIHAIKPYCDVIIIISHLGFALSNSTIPMINVGDVELAEKLSYGEVQLIVGGHSHHELNTQGLSPKNIVNGISIVQTGALGRYLGQVDIKIGQKSTAVTNVRLISTASLPIDQNFENTIVQPVLSQARSLFSRNLGFVSNDPCFDTDYVRNSFASGELALANFITDAIPERLKINGYDIDLAMIDSSSLRKGLTPAQPVSFGDWFNVMPFADTIRLYRLTGKQLFDLLQDNAKRIDRPNEPHTERGFLQFSKNLRYSIALESHRFQSEAVDIFMNDHPIEEQFDKEFLLAGTNFIREYANSWERLDDQHQDCCFIDLHKLNHSDTEIFLRREMVAFIKDAGGISAESGAKLNGRLRIIEKVQPKMSSVSLSQFTQHVGEQNHAMAGAVIAASAAHAVALGQACMTISLKKVNGDLPGFQYELNQVDEIKQKLLHLCDQDAKAINEFVALRESGQELKGKEILCEFPIQVCWLSILAAQQFENFRVSVDERVRDDLEMCIKLLFGTASSAMLLLDSNLRIWTDEDLHKKFEPVLGELLISISKIKPVERIRTNI